MNELRVQFSEKNKLPKKKLIAYEFDLWIYVKYRIQVSFIIDIFLRILIFLNVFKNLGANIQKTTIYQSKILFLISKYWHNLWKAIPWWNKQGIYEIDKFAEKTSRKYRKKLLIKCY